jgi:pimeloyl-ACP methyl ester carboxylesterase
MELLKYKFYTYTITTLLCLFSLVSQAEVLVFIHGYNSAGNVWRVNGITTPLVYNGWSDGGDAIYRTNKSSKKNVFYTVELPHESPLKVQASYLIGYLKSLKSSYPNEQFTLVGHSVGGVVARMATVLYKFPTKRLITIASPNLGTDRAEDALSIGRSPLSWVTPLLGAGTINRSQGLYSDLIRERPNSLLFWLNRLQHPADTKYISIVRAGEGIFGIGVVPPYSQHLEHVYALQNVARSIVVGSGHGLVPIDGQLLLLLLKN